jgi:hypothetical protein
MYGKYQPHSLMYGKYSILRYLVNSTGKNPSPQPLSLPDARRRITKFAASQKVFYLEKNETFLIGRLE